MWGARPRFSHRTMPLLTVAVTITLFSYLQCATPLPSYAQGQSGYGYGYGNAAGGYPDFGNGDPIPGQIPQAMMQNPLYGLFTQQPQYPDPQTVVNPEPLPMYSQGPENTSAKLFTPQTQYPTPQSEQMNGNVMPSYYMGQLLNQAQQERAQSPQGSSYPMEQGAFGQGGGYPVFRGGSPGTSGQRKSENAPPTEEEEQAAEEQKARKKLSERLNEESESVLNQFTAGGGDSLRQALGLISARQCPRAMKVLDRLLLAEPNNAEAHYLKGVAEAYMLDSKRARTEYETAAQLAADTPLADMCRQGITNLSTRHH